MNNSLFYELEVEYLDVLDHFLSSSTSRIICYEMLECVLEIFIMLKRQFIDLSISQSQSKAGYTTLRLSSNPPTSATQKLFQSFSRGQPPPGANNSSSSRQNSVIMSSTMTQLNAATAPSVQGKPSLMRVSQNSNRLIIDSPKKSFQSSNVSAAAEEKRGVSSFQQSYNIRSGLNHQLSLQVNPNLNLRDQLLSLNQSMSNAGQAGVLTSFQLPQPFVIRYRDIFGLYLSQIGRLLLKSPRNEIYKLINQVYFKSEQWREVIKVYAHGIFSEIYLLCGEEHSNAGEAQSDKAVTSLFASA